MSILSEKIQYQESLRGLEEANHNAFHFIHRGIENPSVDDVAKICPHLTVKQIRDILLKQPYTNVRIACPSLVIDGMVHVIEIHGKDENPIDTTPGRKKKKHVPISKRLLSYSCVYNREQNHQRSEVLYIDEAITFAREHWGNDLVTVSCKDRLQFQFVDLSSEDRVNWKDASSVVTIGINEKSSFEMIDKWEGDISILNNLIQIITCGDLEGDEVRASIETVRGEFAPEIFYRCLSCGCSLHRDHCTGCGRTFEDNGWSKPIIFPLPERIIAFMKVHNPYFDESTLRITQEKQLRKYL